ncbi:MAG: hypothetical protein WBV61_09775 [Rhodanobacteraceae bacterium]
MTHFSKALALACTMIAMQPAWSADLVFRSNLEPSDACSYGPPGLTRQTVGNVTYPSGTAFDVDLTQYENIWGRSGPGEPPMPWPAIDGQGAAIDPLNSDMYLAAAFMVPTDLQQLSGIFIHPDGADEVFHASASISETCGDFYVDLASPACVIDSGNRGLPLLLWAIGEDPSPNSCPLISGHTYYLNIMMSPLDDPADSFCPTSGCLMSGLQHLFD